MADKKSATERLNELVGFDTSKQPSATSELFGEVLKKIKEERADIAKKRAEDLLRQALELNEKRIAAKRAFESQDKRFDKELGKLIGRIDGMINGRPPQDDSEDSEE